MRKWRLFFLAKQRLRRRRRRTGLNFLRETSTSGMMDSKLTRGRQQKTWRLILSPSSIFHWTRTTLNRLYSSPLDRVSLPWKESSGSQTPLKRSPIKSPYSSAIKGSYPTICSKGSRKKRLSSEQLAKTNSTKVKTVFCKIHSTHSRRPTTATSSS